MVILVMSIKGQLMADTDSRGAPVEVLDTRAGVMGSKGIPPKQLSNRAGINMTESPQEQKRVETLVVP